MGQYVEDMHFGFHAGDEVSGVAPCLVRHRGSTWDRVHVSASAIKAAASSQTAMEAYIAATAPPGWGWGPDEAAHVRTAVLAAMAF